MRMGRTFLGPLQSFTGRERAIVAKFSNEEDAKTVFTILNDRNEILTALRGNLVILDEELKNRRLSGVPEYIEPVETAVDRTTKAIAVAEGWL
jgi:hypothetical protein